MTFQTVLADPPWKESGAGKTKRGADRHYSLMSLRDIARTVWLCPHWGSIAADAHLYLWVTNNFLPQGLELMRLLEFRYVTNVAWAKPSMGIGQYFRGQHELMLFGVRGKGKSVCSAARNLPTLLHADHERLNGKRVHSAKPEASFRLVEERSQGPYLELFSRRPREGWTAWGNEIEETEHAKNPD